MARYVKANARARDNWITVSIPASGRDAYELGRKKTTGFTTHEFPGMVIDKRDTSGDLRYIEGKRLESRQIEIHCDYYDAEDVSESNTLTYDGGTDTFEVMDIFQDDLNWTAVIVAKLKR